MQKDPLLSGSFVLGSIYFFGNAFKADRKSRSTELSVLAWYFLYSFVAFSTA